MRHLQPAFRWAGGGLLLVLLGTTTVTAGRIIEYKSGIPWQRPKVIDPGPPAGPPSDAVVLFGGRDLAKWEGGEKWLVRDGVATSQNCSIRTKQEKK